MITYTHQTAPTHMSKPTASALPIDVGDRVAPPVQIRITCGHDGLLGPGGHRWLANSEEVVLFNNAGAPAVRRCPACSLRWALTRPVSLPKRWDSSKSIALGFSIGGLVAQEIALRLDLVCRLVLAGTGPRSGESMDTGTPEGNQIFAAVAGLSASGRFAGFAFTLRLGCARPGCRRRYSPTRSDPHQRPRSSSNPETGASWRSVP